MRAYLVLALVALPAFAEAQTASPLPVVDCSLLTPAQARGLHCAAPAGAPVCDPRPNPYLDPVGAAACTAWERDHQPKPVLPVYEVGATYQDGYDAFRMTVLAVSTTMEGVPVVTAEYVKGGPLGSVFAFRVDTGAPWVKVQ